LTSEQPGRIVRYFSNRFKEKIEVEIDRSYMGGMVQKVSLYLVKGAQRSFIWSLLYGAELDLFSYILLEIASLSKPGFSGYSDKTNAYYFYGSRDTTRSLEKDSLEYFILDEVL